MNDQIAIGDMQSMKVYCSIYDHVYKYVFEDDIILHPETLLHHHLQKLNIEISLFSYIYGLDPNRK